jgi:hypothetical protein
MVLPSVARTPLRSGRCQRKELGVPYEPYAEPPEDGSTQRDYS